MARIIGKEDEAVAYIKHAEQIYDAFNKKHLDVDSLHYGVNTQASNLIPLAFGLVPDSIEQIIVNKIVNDIYRHDTHLTTGFIGTRYLLPILSEHAYHDLAWKLAVQESYPSWGYMIRNGATALWEHWNSDQLGPAANSRNHFA